MHNWVWYHAQKGNYKVDFERDERSIQRGLEPIHRRLYRYQIQGCGTAEVLPSHSN